MSNYESYVCFFCALCKYLLCGWLLNFQVNISQESVRLKYDKYLIKITLNDMIFLNMGKLFRMARNSLEF